MAADIKTLGRRIQDPRYTGDNRCTPCTVVNVGLAAILAVGIATLSLGLGGVAFALALGVIWAKGYLVPGTPTLTKRYLPDRVLRAFEKEPGPAAAADGTDDSVDPETFLLEHELIVEDDDIDDLTLEPSFEATLWNYVDAFDPESPTDAGSDQLAVDDTGLDVLAEMLDVDPERLSTTHHGQAFAAYLDAEYLGQWESRSAFVADVAAARALDDHVPEWEQLAVPARSNILGAVRLFVDRCPSCEGPVTLEQEVVDSCCRSYDVVAATCTACQDRLFELELDQPAQARLSGGTAAA